jgi:hypothetical protein
MIRAVGFLALLGVSTMAAGLVPGAAWAQSSADASMLGGSTTGDAASGETGLAPTAAVPDSPLETITGVNSVDPSRILEQIDGLSTGQAASDGSAGGSALGGDPMGGQTGNQMGDQTGGGN